MSRADLSLVDIAELILKEEREPLSVYDLFDKVSQDKGLTDSEKDDRISQFYADITTSAKFVYVGENTWDLKENQKIDLWEKDGSFYKEYTKIDLPAEYLDKPRPKAKVVVDAIEEEVDTEDLLDVVETVEPVEAVEETTEVVEETPVKKEEKPLVEPVTVTEDDEFESDDFDDELFEDFDEEKYNEYMDDYEDQYDE